MHTYPYRSGRLVWPPGRRILWTRSSLMSVGHNIFFVFRDGYVRLCRACGALYACCLACDACCPYWTVLVQNALNHNILMDVRIHPHVSTSYKPLRPARGVILESCKARCWTFKSSGVLCIMCTYKSCSMHVNCIIIVDINRRAST